MSKFPERPFTRHPDEIQEDINNFDLHEFSTKEEGKDYLNFLKWELKATIWIKHIEDSNKKLGNIFLKATEGKSK